MTLTTDRLLLRPFRATDIDEYARMFADPEVARYLGDGRPLSRSDAGRQMAMLVGHWHLRGYGMWAVEERDGGRLIGRIGCHYPEGWPGFEAGWALARQYWGRGYALEGARAALDPSSASFTRRTSGRFDSQSGSASGPRVLPKRTGNPFSFMVSIATGGALSPEKEKGAVREHTSIRHVCS